MRYHVAPYVIWIFALSVSLVSCSAIYGQALDFKVDGPTSKPQGEMVELIVMFPAGVKADVDFTPIDEPDFSVDPIISEDAAGVITLVGRKCSFSTRCEGARTITVVASAFAIIGDGVPRLKSVKHSIEVTAKQAPIPPPKEDPPTTPTGDDDLGPFVPLPGAAVVPANEPWRAAFEEIKADIATLTKVGHSVVDRIETLESRATAVAVSAPVAVADASKPAPVPVVTKAASVASPSIVGVRPGHWSVGSARNEWSPSKEETIAHLRQTHSSSELRKYEPLESLSHEALRTLHDDAHEGRKTTASTTFVSAPAPAPASAAPVAMRAGGCPGGVCPTGSSSRSYSRGVFGWRR